jgi:hypothetical protein
LVGVVAGAANSQEEAEVEEWPVHLKVEEDERRTFL